MAKNDAAVAQGLGKDFVVARKLANLCCELWRQPNDIVSQGVGRQAVEFREHGIEADHDRAQLCEVGHHLGQQMARPRPLADRLQAFVVDIDDRDRARCVRPRLQVLVQIESAQPERFDGSRIDRTHHARRDEKHQADQAAVFPPAEEPDVQGTLALAAAAAEETADPCADCREEGCRRCCVVPRQGLFCGARIAHRVPRFPVQTAANLTQSRARRWRLGAVLNFPWIRIHSYLC